MDILRPVLISLIAGSLIVGAANAQETSNLDMLIDQHNQKYVETEITIDPEADSATFEEYLNDPTLDENGVEKWFADQFQSVLDDLGIDEQYHIELVDHYVFFTDTSGIGIGLYSFDYLSIDIIQEISNECLCSLGLGTPKVYESGSGKVVFISASNSSYSIYYALNSIINDAFSEIEDTELKNTISYFAFFELMDKLNQDIPEEIQSYKFSSLINYGSGFDTFTGLVESILSYDSFSDFVNDNSLLDYLYDLPEEYSDFQDKVNDYVTGFRYGDEIYFDLESGTVTLNTFLDENTVGMLFSFVHQRELMLRTDLSWFEIEETVLSGLYDAFNQPLDFNAYRKEILDSIGDSQIFFYGEKHNNQNGLFNIDNLFFISLLPELKERGFEHIALEIDSYHQDTVDKYMNYEINEYELLDEISYVEATIDIIMAAREYGYKVHCVDERPVLYETLPENMQNPTEFGTHRNMWEDTNINSRVFSDDPDAKLLVFFGAWHAGNRLAYLERTDSYEIPLNMLLEKKYNVFTVTIVNIDSSPEVMYDFDNSLYQRANQLYLFDLKNYLRVINQSSD